MARVLNQEAVNAEQAAIAEAVAAHAAASDPHTGYQKESEKGAANGYAALGGDGKVPSAQLPAGGAGDMLGANNLSEIVNAATARANIGAGTSNFSGAYADLSGKPTLGSAAATDAAAYATAAQGSKADTALQSIAAGSITLAMQANMATASVVYRKTAGSGAPEVQTLATLKTDLALAKADVGLGSVDNTADTAKPVSTAQQTALDLKANLASPTFTGTPAAPTAAAGTDTTQLATTAYAKAAAPNASYRTLLDSSGSHTAARVAGTYAMAQSQPLAITGTGTLYPPNTIYIAAADYPTVNGLAPKLRIRAALYVNDVAPTGNYTVALHPITRPATSGGAGVCIYTVGAAVTGSGVTVNTPAADSMNVLAGSDFALPADGHYVIGVVTTATVATSSLVQISAALQLRNA